ncbi:type II toxin-antitoxin system VapC family toxin [Pseudanabaenaceae cyanobacterium LEGE 13415]|nr:type II toxin-antitoxin system VapC family toxin [Pseudanabaenaceae cyanobacterium LEGE 13415]
MKYLLDTDHFSIFQRQNGQAFLNLKARMTAHAMTDFTISVITLQEQILGSYAYIRQANRSEGIVKGYSMMSQAFRDLILFEMLDFDDPASRVFAEINPGQLRLGVMDARIAAIARSRNLVLLTRNQRDFDKVPKLITQDWTISS